jgi:hypothetical protein
MAFILSIGFFGETEKLCHMWHNFSYGKSRIMPPMLLLGGSRRLIGKRFWLIIP